MYYYTKNKTYHKICTAFSFYIYLKMHRRSCFEFTSPIGLSEHYGYNVDKNS